MSDHDPEAATPEPKRGLFDAPPVVEHDAHPRPEMAVTPPVRRRGGTPWLVTLLLTAGLGGAGYWAWTHPASEVLGGQAGLADSQQGQQIQALTTRVDALEKQPAQAEAVAALTKRLDDLSGRVDGLSTKQEQMAAEAAKQAEITAQKPAQPDVAAPPPDSTAQQVPALMAQQQASDLSKINQGMADQKSALEQNAAEQKSALAQSAADQKSALDKIVADQKAEVAQISAEQKSALAALDQRLAKLEQANGQAPYAAAQKTQQDMAAALGALGDRLGRIEQASGQVQSQDAAAQKAQADDAAALAALSDRLGKLEQASSQVQSEDAAAQKAQAGDVASLAALDSRVDRLEQGQGAASGAAKDATRAIRIEAAETALQAGQPLGPIPGAPPALSRFETAAPPTEAALRLAFPKAADAARAVSQPDTARKSFLDRALARVQQSVVVRRGDRMIVGNPAAGVLARAQQAVDAGDLKGAADTLGGLNGASADAMRDWVGQVRALLDARAALAAMAAHG